MYVTLACFQMPKLHKKMYSELFLPPLSFPRPSLTQFLTGTQYHCFLVYCSCDCFYSNKQIHYIFLFLVFITQKVTYTTFAFVLCFYNLMTYPGNYFISVHKDILHCFPVDSVQLCFPIDCTPPVFCVWAFR